VSSNYNGKQLAAVASLAGFKGANLVMAVAIARAENGSLNPGATHKNSDGSTDYGLWQINSVHGIAPATLLDGAGNAAAAYRISSGGSDWGAWTTYKTGAYHAAMPWAAQQVSAMQSSGGAAAEFINDPPPATQIGNGNFFATTSAGSAVLGVGSGAVNAVESVPQFLEKLSSIDTWERVGFVVAGLALMGFGVVGVFMSTRAGSVAAALIPK
jgi:hypothetical protein